MTTTRWRRSVSVRPLSTGPGSTPIPDPTVLTTAALTREVASLRELVEARLDAMDRAQSLFDANLNRVPTDTDKQVGQLRELLQETLKATGERISHLQALHEEKFTSVQTQFEERDTRSERESKDNKVAVDAAFAAQKEAASEQNKSNTLAIDKSEKATAETLNKQADLFKSTTDALAAQISDIKQWQQRVEGMGSGTHATVGVGFQVWGWVGVGFAVLLGVITLALHLAGK